MKNLGRHRVTDVAGTAPPYGAVSATPAAMAALARTAEGARVHDAAPTPRPAGRRGRDQQDDPEPGTLLCRVAQHGQTGEWMAEDANNHPLQVTTGAGGILEIRAAGNGNDDPDQVRLQAPIARDGNAGAPGELTAGKAFEQRMSAALAPGRDTDQRTPASLRGMQALLNSHYARR